MGFIATPSAHAAEKHAIAMFGEPKYGPNFTHFDYTNPSAPKGGSVVYADVGTFDSLNPNILKGIPADGLGMMYDTLLVSSGDEPFSRYGLVAQTIEISPTRDWVIFNLRKEARFHDGTPMTADDVVFSFNILKEKGHPFYRAYYAEITAVEKLGEHRVKFLFENGENRELPLIIGDLPVLPKAFYADKELDKTTLTLPLGSGPYTIDSFDPGKWVRYRRVEDYWGKDLPVNAGKYNFDVIQYDYYRDATIAVEALKAGEFDLRWENISRTWATAYEGSVFTSGKMVKEELKHELPTGMQAFAINTRLDKFKDPRVRQALGYAFDFEWENEKLFYGAYTRTESYYSNSIYANEGVPEGRELAILEPFRDQLPEEVFTTHYETPKTDGSGNTRENLLLARDLLAEAGWEVKEGVLVNSKTGQPLEIEFLLTSPTFERVVAPYLRNLKKLGIQARMRTVDSSQYIKRVEMFDFDIVVANFSQSNSPGNEQVDYWHSSKADIEGGRNIIGIKDPVVDALVEKIITADSKETLIATTQALDRVLLWSHYVVPNWHIRHYRLAYWNRFSRPEITPKYELGLDTWWLNSAKDVKLDLVRPN
jgi:microcin C transport system substrate-binding protein